MTQFSQLRPRLAHLLLEGLRTEEDSANRVLLLWSTAVFLYENVEYQGKHNELLINKMLHEWSFISYLAFLLFTSECFFADIKDFPYTFIILLMSKILSHAWSADDTLQGLQVLSEMSKNFTRIFKSNKVNE